MTFKRKKHFLAVPEKERMVIKAHRFKPRHLTFLEDVAALEKLKNPESEMTPSDVVRFAVEQLMKRYNMYEEDA